MPCVVSSQTTPSSGVSNSVLWTKFSQAKIMAASVASASTTAPRLTLRFCFITGPGRVTPHRKISGANECPFFGRVDLQKPLYISITYRMLRLETHRQSTLWKDTYSFPKPILRLELETESAPERPEGGHEGHPAVHGSECHVALSKKVVAFRVGLPAARAKLGQALVHPDMKIRLHVKQGLTKAVHTSERHPADPLVACCKPRAGSGHLGGDLSPSRVSPGGAE